MVYKRFSDFFFSLLLIILLLPVFFVIVILIIFESLIIKKDILKFLFIEERISQNKSFFILKFKTFFLDENDNIYDKYRGTTDYINKRRLSIIGKVLRKYYLDELPQLFNILGGSMSFVGPRPWPYNQYKNIVKSGFLAKKKLKAGLCGPAQYLKGKSTLDIMLVEEEKMIYEYEKTFLSVFFYDLKMILKTFFTCLKGGGY